jgi:DNA-binding CsgD family transcriptional regulator
MVAREGIGSIVPDAIDMPHALRQPLASAATSPRPELHVAALARHLGFDGLSYFSQSVSGKSRHEHGTADLFSWTTGAPAWNARYRDHGYAAVDPRLAPSRQLTPFLWDRVRCSRNAAVERFLADAVTEGIASGAVIQFRDPLGARIVVAFDSTLASMDEVRIEFVLDRLGTLMLVASTLHDWVFAPRIEHLRSRADPQGLSSCEIRCLVLAARGHTSTEIGQMLQIKRRTADFHMHNVIRKLGALNRSEAIGRAVAKGLVGG